MSRIHHLQKYSSLPILSWIQNEMKRARNTTMHANERLSELNDALDLTEDETALDAGDALRAADIEAASNASPSNVAPAASPQRNDDPCKPVHREALEKLSMDELREMAFGLQVPDRSTITEKSELIDEICKRL